jgi:hypothetical protein
MSVPRREGQSCDNQAEKDLSMRCKVIRGVAAVAAVVILHACGGITDPSDNTLEPFAGTLAVGGQNEHLFSASKNGEFEIRVTELSPTPTVFIGTAFGQVISNVCQPLFGYRNDFSQLNRASLTGPITKGSYCVFVYDSGALTETQNYTVRVSHP